MSLHPRGNLPLSAVIVQAIRAAWPESRAKNVARATGCSVDTGKRIARMGRASNYYMRRLLPVVRERIGRNLNALEALDANLKAIEMEETTHRIIDRRSAMVRANPAKDTRQNHGPRLPLVAPRARTERAR